MRLQSLGFATSLITVVSVLACKETTSTSFDSENQSAAPGSLSFAKLPPGCKNVHGKVDLTVIPSPNDPLGRSIGPSTGALKGAVSSTLTSLIPVGGEIHVTSLDVLVAGPTDIITSNATTTYAPIPGEPIGTVSVETAQSITSGTGKYAGATGTIVVTGTGYNLFGPGAGPGSTWFDLKYEGTVCT